MIARVAHPGPWEAKLAPCGTRLGMMSPTGPVFMLGMLDALHPRDVHRAEASPDLEDALAGLVEAVERDTRENGGISGHTSARLADARAALAKARSTAPLPTPRK